MENKKKEHPKEKFKLHPRNAHRERYDFKKLIVTSPDLEQYVKTNIHGDDSIDFFDPNAVRMLNTALLKHFYNIKFWDIPPDYLCPPIPGRADYIHHMADLLGSSNFGEIPRGDKVKCLDIGVGANCVYPIIGTTEYSWSFVGTDIDAVAIESAREIIKKNPSLKGKIELRMQANPKDIFYGIFKHEERFDLTISNPPFYGSAEEADKESLRKLTNLKKGKPDNPVSNFGGKNNELWCEGGGTRFIREMIRESKRFSTSCFWFSTLVSKEAHLKTAQELLIAAKASMVKTIPMGQGNKSSRILAWTYLTFKERKNWQEKRWKDEEEEIDVV